MTYLEKLRSLMGYWQCGSDQIISIAQDGNTGLYWVVCKHRWYECGVTLEAAIDTAYEIRWVLCLLWLVVTGKRLAC